jgi:hypothetical protein
MTIIEVFDSWDSNRLLRILYVPDYKISVLKSHGVSLKKSIDLCCQEAHISKKTYYDVLYSRYRHEKSKDVYKLS